MRVLGVVLVLVLCVCGGAAGVQVKVGDRSFDLEAVKQLMLLMDLDNSVNSHLSESSVAAVCSDPLLPQSFLPVCQGKGAGITFAKLVDIMMSVDPCEICANPACFGCLY